MPLRGKIKQVCLYCLKEFEALPCEIARGRSRFCSKSCVGKYYSGELSRGWRGGGYKNTSGYIRVWLAPNDFFRPMANKAGYVLEHRLVVAKVLGRCLQTWEIVHHKGIRYTDIRNKSDNLEDNLEITSSLGEHIANHTKGHKDGYQKGGQDGKNAKIRQLEAQIK